MIKNKNFFITVVSLLLTLFVSQVFVFAQSIDVSITVPELLDPPTNISPRGNLTEINISFVPNPSPLLTSQVIQISEDSGLSFPVENILLPTDTTFQLDGFTPSSIGTSRVFRLISVDDLGRRGPFVQFTGRTSRTGGGSGGGGPSPGICGNGVVQGAEQCDDGNTNNNDGCSSSCTIEACGDGTLQTGESCDDGNIENNDGCSNSCELENALLCGNNEINLGEQCDDGNVNNDDGCSATCQLENILLCGDGNLDAGESCDDGNIDSSDGCSATCQIEVPQVCTNGIVEGTEQCDDGNTVNGDGCSAICEFEELATNLIAPDPSKVDEDQITLTLEVIDPNNEFAFAEVFISKDGGEFTQIPGQFTTTEVIIENLEDGTYEVFSIGVNDVGQREETPETPDAMFIINLVPTLNVSAKPEKRVPKQGNWSTNGLIYIYNNANTTPFVQYLPDTNDSGVAILDNEIISGTYDTSFKGRSHLTKFLRGVVFDSAEDIDLDFTFGDTYRLLAGDVHVSKDDYVNGLDFSAMVKVLYNEDLDADLNLDYSTNGLDLSIAAINIFKEGETLE